MKYEAIMFDLDGTLLPMDYEEFMKGYFKLLTGAVAKFGYTYETLIPAMWKGVGAMMKNDGSRTNSDAFWQVFAGIFGEGVYEQIPTFDEFYKTKFHEAKAYTQPTELSRKIVDAARKVADKVILATNPLFPAVAVEARLSWIGLSPDDFDLVTTYDNSCLCKPNPAYFTDIMKRFSLSPERCLMVGNNTEEDIKAAKAAGMNTYLVTDCLICEKEMPDTPDGSLSDFLCHIAR